jgi:hypothetical protein
MKVVLVCITNFQSYIIDNIKSLLLLKNDVTVLTNFELFQFFDSYKEKINLIDINSLNDSYRFYDKTNLDKNFRDGFWTLTSLRFFLIYEYMKKYNVTDIIHIENDVLIYYNVDKLIPFLNNKYIYTTFDCFKRNIASIMYIPSHEILKIALDHYNLNSTDMTAFVEIKNTTFIIKNFPIFHSDFANTEEEKFVSENFNVFNYIFDAAAIGQYIGGVDPRNIYGDTRGFVNETCVIKYNNYKILWEKIDKINKPFLLIENIKVPIFNLHIHSKQLEKYITDDTSQDFDIVIPLGPNDKDIIEKQLYFTKKNIIGYRNIYIVSYDKDILFEGCITLSENIFPFSLQTVSGLHGKLNRNGWYLQQLIKLYAGIFIPEIMDKYLVIDCDTFFLKPTMFIQNNICFYNYGMEYHYPYFNHMQKLYHELKKIDETKSGICHHMMFETTYIKELFHLVEHVHNDLFYNVFLKNVEINDYEHSGASEYEIYFNFMLLKHPDKIIIRKLNWKNENNFDNILSNKDCDYLSFHWYNR